MKACVGFRGEPLRFDSSFKILRNPLPVNLAQINPIARVPDWELGRVDFCLTLDLHLQSVSQSVTRFGGKTTENGDFSE